MKVSVNVKIPAALHEKLREGTRGPGNLSAAVESILTEFVKGTRQLESADKTIKTTCSIDVNVVAAIGDLAAKMDVTPTHLIRMMLQKYLIDTRK